MRAVESVGVDRPRDLAYVIHLIVGPRHQEPSTDDDPTFTNRSIAIIDVNGLQATIRLN
jgi:hypothetical protein